MGYNWSELTDQERAFKEMYKGEGRSILSTPMEYAQYIQIVQLHPEFVDLGDFYEVHTKAQLGSTILDVGELESGEEITVQKHERYGYPIIHNHAFIEIAYLYSGQCTHYVEQQSFLMEEGDFCILAPNAKHTIVAVEDSALLLNILLSKEVLNQSFLCMVKEKRLLADFFENILFGKHVSPYLIFPTGKDPWMHQVICEMLCETKERRYAYRESLKLYIQQMFIHVLRHYEMQARVSDPLEQKMEDMIVPILGYISINYNRVTLRQVAEFFNYSEAYMSRLLKRYTGKTFGALITGLQMKRTEELLVSSEMRLIDIAQEVGCFDYSHLSRKFKQVYGESPDVYRKNKSNIYI